MFYTTLWIDHSEAKIFNFAKKEDPDIFHLPNVHHTSHHNPSHIENEKKEQLKKFYHDIQDKIKNSEGVLIVGPSFAKNEFQAYLQTHHPKGLGKSILGLQPMDKATDHEITELSKQFFLKYELFN